MLVPPMSMPRISCPTPKQASGVSVLQVRSSSPLICGMAGGDTGAEVARVRRGEVLAELRDRGLGFLPVAVPAAARAGSNAGRDPSRRCDGFKETLGVFELCTACAVSWAVIPAPSGAL